MKKYLLTRFVINEVNNEAKLQGKSQAVVGNFQ